MKKYVIGLFCASVLMSAVATVDAAPVLTQAFPDMFVDYNTISYNAGTQAFTAKGAPITFSLAASQYYNVTNVTLNSYNLTATVDHSGQATGGTLSVSGKVSDIGATSGTLLTGSFVDFGFGTGASGDPFEFVFAVTGGDLASYYGGIGGKIGVILSAKSTNFTGFASSFNSGSGATNDTFAVVPEPASMGLLVVAGLFLARRRGRNR